MLPFRNVFLLVFSLLCLGCEKMRISSQEIDDLEVSSYYYQSDSLLSADVLQRAWEMANVEWTPLNPVPRGPGSYYEIGKKVTGIPYSSVKEINTYLFQDVSYYTFMTAVHNPKSVLYTENISVPPYHGLNCAPYYGGVCSSTVMYALGISIPYYSRQIISLPFINKLASQSVDSLKVCDVIWKSGHVQMVFDVEHRADTLYRIAMFESSGKSAHILNYTAREFKEMWTTNGYVAYRYDNIIYTRCPDTFRGFNPIDYNDDLCPSKGDKAVYRADDTILINIFNSSFHEIVLQKDDSDFMSGTCDNDSYCFSDLLPGIYTCYLQSGAERSKTVSFEVVMTDVKVDVTNNGNVLIRFQSNVAADYVAICDEHGTSDYYPISEEARQKGFIVVPSYNYSAFYCKVIFKGEFGRIANKPIKIY